MNKPLALVIEDDGPHADLFSEALQKAGFEVEIIRDGKDALSRLNKIIPSMVVLDLHLPHVSGLDILNHIRADFRLAKTRVLIISADTQMISLLHEKADIVLTKPVSYFQLRELAERFRVMADSSDE
jgi:two-component system, cell cycle response regulator DivK